MKIDEQKKQELAQLLVDWKNSGGVGLETTINCIADILEGKGSGVECKYPPLNKDLAIEEVMKHFNFSKVQKAMSSLNWTWYNTPAGFSVPTLDEVMACARNLLEKVCYGKFRSVSSGGFVAKYNEEEQVLSLDFVLTSWDYYEE